MRLTTDLTDLLHSLETRAATQAIIVEVLVRTRAWDGRTWTYGPAAAELGVTKQTVRRLLQRDRMLAAAARAALIGGSRVAEPA
jgi:predicted DNA-binding protein (UPF0251 family)